MSDRIEILFEAADQIAQAVLKSKIPLSIPEFDPLSENGLDPISWPETWLRYKEKVKSGEKEFGYEPLTNLQWMGVEMYLKSQYGLSLEEKNKC